MKLTTKQKAFADEYIKSGNASDAARKAGYSKKTAYRMGQDNLRKRAIADYIADRMRPTEEKRIADADEVIAFYTAVMRGEIKDQFGIEASLSDRIKAGTELMKRHAVAEARNTGDSVNVIIDV